MNIAALLDRSATTFGARPAVAVGHEVLHDHVGLRRRSASFGHGVAAAYGLDPGDRVAVFMANTPEYVEVLFGIWWAGLAAVPVNAKLHATECAYIVEHSGARVCIVDGDHADAVTSVPVVVVGSDVYRDLVSVDAVEPLVLGGRVIWHGCSTHRDRPVGRRGRC